MVAAAIVPYADSIVRAERRPVTSAANGTVYSVNSERVRTVNGRRQVWMKGDHSRNRAERARSSMTLVSIDCSASTIRTLADNKYDSYGKTISTRTNPEYGVGYDPIAPETVAEDVNLVCRQGGGE
jgi:hypothetical protein